MDTLKSQKDDSITVFVQGCSDTGMCDSVDNVIYTEGCVNALMNKAHVQNNFLIIGLTLLGIMLVMVRDIMTRCRIVLEGIWKYNVV